MAKADNLQDFAGGNDKQRSHLNAVIEAVKENRKDIDKMSKGKITVLAIQDTKLVELKLNGKKIREVPVA